MQSEKIIYMERVAILSCQVSLNSYFAFVFFVFTRSTTFITSYAVSQRNKFYIVLSCIIIRYYRKYVADLIKKLSKFYRKGFLFFFHVWNLSNEYEKERGARLYVPHCIK